MRSKPRPTSNKLIAAARKARMKTARCPKCGSFIRRGQHTCPNGHRFAKEAPIGKKFKYAAAC